MTASLPEDRLADGDLILYDYFKHMTTLALVTLGGILSISQTAGVAVALERLLPSLAFVSLSGTMALFGMETIIKRRLEGEAAPRAVRWSRMVVTGSFGIGVGAFLGAFMDAIGR